MGVNFYDFGFGEFVTARFISHYYRAPLLWANLLKKYKTATSLDNFKTKIKTWKCETCACRLCQTYHQNLGFL